MRVQRGFLCHRCGSMEFEQIDDAHLRRAEWPAEGVKKILTQNGDFVADPQLEKYSLTFNPGGFLKRVGRKAG